MTLFILYICILGLGDVLIWAILVQIREGTPLTIPKFIQVHFH